MSHNRSEVISLKTLAFLEREGFTDKEVTIFVHSQWQKLEYVKRIVDRWNVVVGADNYTDQYNWMFNWFDEGEEVLFCDDDITGLIIRQGSEYRVPNLKEFALTAFADNSRIGCHLWGVYPSANRYFLRDAVSYRLKLIIGQLYGMKVRKLADPWITVPMKVDYELSIKHYLRDGMVCRYNFLAASSKVYSGKGGLQTPDRPKLSQEASEQLLQSYPNLVELKESCGKFTEISLK